MKHYLTLLAIAAILTGCERDMLSEEEYHEAYNPQQVICISPSTEPLESESDASRGTPITSVSQMTNISVFCAHTGANNWTPTAAAGKMFDTPLVRNATSGRWEYIGAPVKWNPVTGSDRYTFFAYAPYASTQNGVSVQGSSATSGVPTIIYTAPTNVADQPDLMFAVPRYNISSARGVVSLQMKHVLTCVGFQVQGNGERIKAITISGTYAAGTAKINGDTLVWSYFNQPPAPIDYSPSINFDAGQSYVTAQPTMSTNLIAGNGYLMMVPQILGANAKLILTFSDNSKREISLNNQPWAAGKRVTYNIIITPDGILTLSPLASYISELGTTYKTDNIQLSCDPIDMKWTLTCDVAWLRITTNSNGTSASNTASGKGPATIYTIADPNTLSVPRIAKFFSQNKPTQVAATITQLQHTNLALINNGGTSPTTGSSYVGAFWRADQTGERIIHIPTTGATGVWTASVVWMDGSWQPDDIRFATSTSLDTQVSYTQDLTPGDAENFKVTNSLTLASGTVAANSAIYFRMGLMTPFTATEAKPARYAVVALTHSGLSRTQLILLRQGHDADYVMGKYDSSNALVRPKARRISPYNITQSTFTSWVGGALINEHPIVALGGGKFTKYPTQAGAYFTWASTDQIRRAYHPTTPTTAITSWSQLYPNTYWKEGIVGIILSDIHETCPPGYRRINDGSETTATTMAAADSELRQTLLLTLGNGSTTGDTNSSTGYYADGFFDRRQIKNSPTGRASTCVSYYTATSDPRNADIAYSGVLTYNPTTWASIFLPFSGARNRDSGALVETGYRGYFWTSSSLATRSYASGFLADVGSKIYIGYEFTRNVGVSVRCVKIE